MAEPASMMAYLGLSGLIKWTVNYMWRDRRPSNLEKAGEVTGLYLYPVKSAKGISLTQIQCSSEKAAHSGSIVDRQWMVITGDNVGITAREEPQLLGLVASFEAGKLVITTPDQQTVTVDPKTVDKTGKRTTIKMFFGFKTPLNHLTGLDCGQEVAQFLSDYLKKPGCRLLYSSPTINQRKVLGDIPMFSFWMSEAKEEDMLSFQDLIPFHIQVEESLADLSKRLDKAVKADRFRPTILVSSGMEPYSEDTWSDVFIGDVRFKGINPMDRCTLPNIDPETFKRDPNFQISKTLRSYRPHGVYGPYLGLNLVVQKPGTIKIGDPVYVVRGDGY